METNSDQALTVWRDGGWTVSERGDAYYTQNDPDWLLTIPLTLIMEMATGSHQETVIGGQGVIMSQSNPIPGKDNVTPIARDTFLGMLDRREKQGIETYGRSLQTNNGRCATLDLMEELVDAWQYAVQEDIERAELETEHYNLIQENEMLEKCCEEFAGMVQAYAELCGRLERVCQGYQTLTNRS